MKTVIKDLTQDLELYLTPAYLIAHVFMCKFLFQAGGFSMASVRPLLMVLVCFFYFLFL